LSYGNSTVLFTNVEDFYETSLPVTIPKGSLNPNFAFGFYDSNTLE